jgi:hypothetical protein
MYVNFLSWTEQQAGGGSLCRRPCCKQRRRQAVRRLLRPSRVYAALPLLLLSACATTGCDSRSSSEAIPPVARNPVTQVSDKLHAVTIRPAPHRMTVDTELKDRIGSPVTVACNTCHAVRPANPQNRTSEDLDLFHQGLQFDHGRQACMACHNPADGYASLHLADGTTSRRFHAALHAIVRICDYEHGARRHGGWDLTRPSQRNHCVHCHDPHARKSSSCNRRGSARLSAR